MNVIWTAALALAVLVVPEVVIGVGVAIATFGTLTRITEDWL